MMRGQKDEGMRGQGGEGVRFFCTAGNGMEAFVEEEVKRKLAAENVLRSQGKVFFSSSAHVTSLVSLKAAERLFLLLKLDSPLNLRTHPSHAQISSLLREKLASDSEEWRSAAASWRRLQGALRDRTTASVPSARAGVKRRREEEEKEEEEESPEHRQLLCDGESRVRTEAVEPLSFRVCCKCSGAVARRISAQDVCKVLGGSLSAALGWKADLKNPQLEINVNLSDDHCLIGIPLTKRPLANRSYMRNSGLRSTVAWAMGSIVEIQPGSCVLDPMCGVGTILIEAAQEHKEARFLGLDIDDGQLQKAKENLAFAELEDRVQLLRASSMALPLSSAAVDAVVCDLPFGRKFGTKMDIAINLPNILSEMERVLRVGGCLVLLLSPQLSSLLKKLVTPEDTKSTSVQEEKNLTEERPSVASCTKQLFRKGGPLSSLRHEKTVRVSLGAIDGLIHKYVKISV